MQSRVITIIVLVLIALLVIGYSFFQYFQSRGEEPTEEEETAELEYPAVTPEMVVEGFYDWYITDDNALPNTGYRDAESLTQDFINTIDEKTSTTSEEMSYDPFVCHEEIPTEFTARPTEIIEDRTTVVVDEIIGEDEEEISHTVDLILRDNSWKIENIICFIKG